MKRISQTFCILLLLGLLGITNAEATWRVGGSLGLGQYKATDVRGLKDTKSGQTLGIGMSLTLPNGFYTRLDTVNFKSGVMQGSAGLMSFGWRHEIFDLYHIAWALGLGGANVRDNSFKYDDKYDDQSSSQYFISVGYRLWPLVDIALGFQVVSSDADFTDERDSKASVISANLIYNFE